MKETQREENETVVNKSTNSFSDLLGDDLIFFNKDEATETPFHKRRGAMEHDDDCVCRQCLVEFPNRTGNKH